MAGFKRPSSCVESSALFLDNPLRGFASSRPGGPRMRGRAIACFVVTVTALASLTAGQAEDYPARPIRLIVSSPAGSLVDVLSRLLTQDLGPRLGQTLVADHRAGAMPQVALEPLIRAPADGYTLM